MADNNTETIANDEQLNQKKKFNSKRNNRKKFQKRTIYGFFKC